MHTEIKTKLPNVIEKSNVEPCLILFWNAVLKKYLTTKINGLH